VGYVLADARVALLVSVAATDGAGVESLVDARLDLPVTNAGAVAPVTEVPGWLATEGATDEAGVECLVDARLDLPDAATDGAGVSLFSLLGLLATGADGPMTKAMGEALCAVNTMSPAPPEDTSFSTALYTSSSIVVFVLLAFVTNGAAAEVISSSDISDQTLSVDEVASLVMCMRVFCTRVCGIAQWEDVRTLVDDA